MTGVNYRRRLEKLLAAADILIDGDRPWDLRVHHPDLFRRILAQGSLGFGEAYMDGWWDCPAIDQMICRAMRARLDRRLHSLALLVDALRARLSNRQSRRRAFQVGKRHYDIGNDLYRRMLDERMIYSCGYWQDADTLDRAQENKLDLICRKLQLAEGQKVLDIGCGWGGTARYLAERHGVEVTGITVSTAQAELAREYCRDLPIEILVRDYRDLKGRFDRILSVGMFEHVGYKNYVTYFRKVSDLLTDDGLFLLHTIAGNETTVRTDPWIERYIFPNGMLPSASQVTKAWEGLLVLEDWHNFGPDYDRTLMAWQSNFEEAWPDLRKSYDERFRRMWNYYLLSSAGAFRARENQVWQIVLSRQGIPGGYRIAR
ncbi:cyclopropane fatty acyl phospholipid synthase [Geothermobacter hydrogeniphilus]|uniref:Cyclopropane-fatty-acyl-phospholipid synthase n=1 Tax=Geothermobacter hydrogeniphilus TaxID=1969733 RepID=A0A1X0Y3Y0_9BACT|nr:cyclopropane fatty acyl phospholipid synthase [Geothermobacter hydrogeniphilus]ORJ59839.1 cyclopropane-fatty-acyl-phospholipid synthase [Geothermobacter hydrogeniphilus]